MGMIRMSLKEATQHSNIGGDFVMVKRMGMLNTVLLLVLIISILLGMLSTSLYATENLGTNQRTIEINGGDTAKYKCNVSGIEYYESDTAIYAFKDGRLVSVESHGGNIDFTSRSNDLENTAASLANKYVDLTGYDLVNHRIFDGNIHEYTWAKCIGGIETQDKVVVDISETGTEYIIAFPSYGSYKGAMLSTTSDASITEIDACQIFMNTALSINCSKKDVSPEISKKELIYNENNTLIWRIEGGVDYSNQDGVELSEYLQVEVDASTGDIISILY